MEKNNQIQVKMSPNDCLHQGEMHYPYVAKNLSD